MTFWYFCSIFHLKGSQSALQAGANRKIMSLLMKCSHLQVRMQQAFDARNVHPCFEKRIAFWFWTCLRHRRLEEHLQIKAVWCPSLAPRYQHQEPLSTVSASSSGLFFAFCTQSEPYKVK